MSWPVAPDGTSRDSGGAGWCVWPWDARDPPFHDFVCRDSRDTRYEGDIHPYVHVRSVRVTTLATAYMTPSVQVRSGLGSLAYEPYVLRGRATFPEWRDDAAAPGGMHIDRNDPGHGHQTRITSAALVNAVNRYSPRAHVRTPHRDMRPPRKTYSPRAHVRTILGHRFAKRSPRP